MEEMKTGQHVERKQGKEGHSHPGEGDIGVKLGHYAERKQASESDLLAGGSNGKDWSRHEN